MEKIYKKIEVKKINLSKMQQEFYTHLNFSFVKICIVHKILVSLEIIRISLKVISLYTFSRKCNRFLNFKKNLLA